MKLSKLALAVFAKEQGGGDKEPTTDHARTLLKDLCPEFLAKFENDNDRLVKVARSVADLVRSVEKEESSKLEESLQTLQTHCEILASLTNVTVPKVRFGKTEVQMPIVTLGGMRYQQTWDGTKITDISQVDPECQENIKETLKYAISLGINHIETAKGYGCSELQLGQAFKELFESGDVKREDLIIQTKVGPQKTAEEFRKIVEESFTKLQLDYIDLFSFHGLNYRSDFDLLFNNGVNGNLYDVIQEYVDAGRIKHVGFSTHAPYDFIEKLIKTDKFEYCNLHHHFVGSYTASGHGPHPGNANCIKLLQERDMGVFIISPYDKGGRLYAPSRILRDLCLPDFEPIVYGSLWCWSHNPSMHTIVCGAARPSDLDEPIIAATLLGKEGTAEKVKHVTKRLDDAYVEALGQEWVDTWYHGLPNGYETRFGTHIAQQVWLYNLMLAYGMKDFAKERYTVFDGSAEKWDKSLSLKEILEKNNLTVWGWCPGTAFEPGLDYTEDLSDVPESNRARVLEALELVYDHCSKHGEKKNEYPKGWETAYDMRPWTAFPERG